MSSNFPKNKKNVDWGTVAGSRRKKPDKSRGLGGLIIKGHQENPLKREQQREPGFEEFQGKTSGHRSTFAFGVIFLFVMIAVGWFWLNN